MLQRRRNVNYGMLWFDNDPKTDLPQKVNRAAAYYRRKYGQSPNLCFVNPEMATTKKGNAGEVEIKTSPTILPHHIWIGRNASENGTKGV
jgi:hypothetical protein